MKSGIPTVTQFAVRRNTNGQTFSELAVLFAVVFFAILLMGRYVKRSTEGRVFTLVQQGFGARLYTNDHLINITYIESKNVDHKSYTTNNETYYNEIVHNSLEVFTLYEESKI